MQLQRLTGLERQKILDELAELLKLIERLLRDPVERQAADADRRRRAAGGPRQVRRRAPHRDHRRGGRVPDRGPDRRGRHGDHGQQHRLHQADGDHHLPQPAARRQGPHRHAHARGGLRQPPLRRLDARLHHDLLGPRPRLLAEGPRDSGRRAGRPRQGDREPGVDGGGRADRGARSPSRSSRTTSSSSWARAAAWSRRPS